MHKQVIIREDDICFFTKPSQLEVLYKPLFELNLPINVAVIPKVYCGVTLQGLRGLYIDPDYRGKNTFLSVKHNAELVKFLTKKNIEILQHGYSHEMLSGVPEFRIKDEEKMENRIESGKKIIHRAFGVKPRFFVPPLDTLSRQGYHVVSRNYDGTLQATTSHTREGILDMPMNFIPRFLPLDFIPAFMISRLKNRNYCIHDKFLIIEHKGLCVSPELDEKTLFDTIERFLSKWKIITIVNHHWLFSSSSGLLNIWRRMLNMLLADDRTNIVSISDAYESLVQKN